VAEKGGIEPLTLSGHFFLFFPALLYILI
jgi:hypothetical protein